MEVLGIKLLAGISCLDTRRVERGVKTAFGVITSSSNDE